MLRKSKSLKLGIEEQIPCKQEQTAQTSHNATLIPCCEYRQEESHTLKMSINPRSVLGAGMVVNTVFT